MLIKKPVMTVVKKQTDPAFTVTAAGNTQEARTIVPKPLQKSAFVKKPTYNHPVGTVANGGSDAERAASALAEFNRT
jgi:hypothetical protein